MTDSIDNRFTQCLNRVVPDLLALGLTGTIRLRIPISNNVLNGTGILLLPQEFYHLCQRKHGSEEISSVIFDVFLYFRDMTIIIFNPSPGINEVSDTDPPPPEQRIQEPASSRMPPVVSIPAGDVSP
ncbi:MAG: hypothetical protein MUO95_01700 [Methanoregula sp.]|nr:hypothetical protein [Methanoregula sp.]